MAKRYTKIIQSGSLIEVYEFAKRPLVSKRGVKKKSGVRRKRNDERRYNNIKACRKAFVRLVRANLGGNGFTALLTLTIADVLSISESNKKLSKFFTEIRRLYKSVRYIAVPEFQTRGAVHYHALVWGLSENVVRKEKRNRRVQNIWGWGYCDIIKTDSNIALAYYLGKYLSKGMHDTRLAGKKAYSGGGKLYRPTIINSEKNGSAIEYVKDMIVDNSLAIKSEFEYTTLYLGRGNYKSYNLDE